MPCDDFDNEWNWNGAHIKFHYTLIDSFRGMLDPEGTISVLMHAMSSDRGIISAYTNVKIFKELENFHNVDGPCGCDELLMEEWLNKCNEEERKNRKEVTEDATIAQYATYTLLGITTRFLWLVGWGGPTSI